MMRAAVLAILLSAWPASAEVPYTITLTDEQAETLAEQARLSVRGQRGSVALTPDQVLANAVRGLIDGWAAQQLAESRTKPWAQRTDREKALHCRVHKIESCPK